MNEERDRHRGEVEEPRGDVNVLATKLRQREEELELLRANASSYIHNILVQEAGWGGGGYVDNNFNAMLMQAAGYRNKFDAVRNRHREEVEELGGGGQCTCHKVEAEGGQIGTVEGRCKQLH